MSTSPLLKINDLTKHFVIARRMIGENVVVYAVDDVSFSVNEGETFAIVGESGSGKSTVGRCILRLIEPTRGEVYLDGEDIIEYNQRDLRLLRRKMQMVFQDPADSLNPRFTVQKTLTDALWHRGYHNRKGNVERSVALLEQVGLERSDLTRFPHQFSGGQQQRIAIARALAFNPILLFLDEPTASLDVSVQSQVLKLLQNLQEELKLSYILVSHDLSTVRHSSQRVCVMYLGRIVEMGETTRIFSSPQHPYTKELMAAVPIPDPKIKHASFSLRGEVPSPVAPPPGCRFHTRCPISQEICSQELPLLEPTPTGQMVACHLAEKLSK